jgi:glycosyltransferase involved in cell wall biosynthesis
LVYDLNRTDFFCIFISAGDALAGLKSLAEQLDLTDYVSFTGWVKRPEVARYLSIVDICVALEPSNAYNDNSTMIKIMEYVALKKPIVAFDLPEHRFTALAATLYVQPNNEFHFAQTLAQLADDPACRQAMGEFGWWRKETELAWQYSNPNLLKTYCTFLRRLSDESSCL